MAIQSERNQREKNEAKLSGMVAGAFNSLYKDKFGIYDKVIFCIYDRLKEQEKYIDVNYAANVNAFRVDINPVLMEESKKTIIQNGKRAAIKMFLMKKGLPYKDSSQIYRKYAKMFNLWIYSSIAKDKQGKIHVFEYPETPHKWHVYSCSICGRPMLVYGKKLSNNHSINKMNTVWHKKNSRSETEKPHQGKYAYAGLQELKNWEFKSIKMTMNKIIRDYKGGWDTKPRYYYKY